MSKIKHLCILAILLCITYSAKSQVCVGEAGTLKWEFWTNIYDRKMGELHASYNFPKHPDRVVDISKTQSPRNYDNYMGGRIRGFIKVDQTQTVTFNITGNNTAHFYLSSTSSPDDKNLSAFTQSYTSPYEHDKYPEQTTNPVTLQGGVHYYFELLYVEDYGSDHVYLFWKNPDIAANEWRIITDQYLYGVDCVDTCPPRGTPCDDGDASTSDDIEDGNCNCFGTPTTSNSCVGARKQITAYRYDGIPGNDLNTLYNHPSYPAMPSTSEGLDFFGSPVSSEHDSIGTLVQAFLTVPVSGLYKFNITSDNNSIFFLSSDDDPANKQAHQILVTSGIGMTDHDAFLWQNTSNIFLEKNKYYYVEINHKQGTYNSHYSVFWQTPYTEADTWKRIPSEYIYDYNCEISCVPTGTLCDDGDPFTNNDMYDANCNCVGTPCEPADCDSPLANYIPYAKCDVTDAIDNNESNNWLSCTKSQNPIAEYGLSHWIQYDLGGRHKVFDSHFWNYNVENQTALGFQNVAIHYSQDASVWTHLGDYNWMQAPGTSGYSGFPGPDFMGEYARYILITCLDAGEGCKGIGKSSFRIVKCPLAGTACDDKNAYTIDDKYDDNCLCAGKSIEENDCNQDYLALGDSTLHEAVHSATIQVSSVSQVANHQTVGLVAGSAVILEPGFDTGDSTIVIASIDPCTAQRSSHRLVTESAMEQYKKKLAAAKLEPLQISTDEEEGIVTVQYYVEQPGHHSISISNENGYHYELSAYEVLNKGVYTKYFRTDKLSTGTYNITLSSAKSNVVERLTLR